MAASQTAVMMKVRGRLLREREKRKRVLIAQCAVGLEKKKKKRRGGKRAAIDFNTAEFINCLISTTGWLKGSLVKALILAQQS